MRAVKRKPNATMRPLRIWRPVSKKRRTRKNVFWLLQAATSASTHNWFLRQWARRTTSTTWLRVCSILLFTWRGNMNVFFSRTPWRMGTWGSLVANLKLMKQIKKVEIGFNFWTYQRHQQLENLLETARKKPIQRGHCYYGDFCYQINMDDVIRMVDIIAWASLNAYDYYWSRYTRFRLYLGPNVFIL